MSRLAKMISLMGLSVGMITAPAVAARSDDSVRQVADALLAGDYVGAEARIAQLGMDKSDPVMLINLGNAYAGMGRKADAQIAYNAALNSAEEIDLDMADGSVRSSREVAQVALDRLGTRYAGR